MFFWCPKKPSEALLLFIRLYMAVHGLTKHYKALYGLIIWLYKTLYQDPPNRFWCHLGLYCVFLEVTILIQTKNWIVDLVSTSCAAFCGHIQFFPNVLRNHELLSYPELLMNRCVFFGSAELETAADVGAILAHFGNNCRGMLERIWRHFELLGPCCGHFGPSWAILEPSRPMLGSSWSLLGPILDHPCFKRRPEGPGSGQLGIYGLSWEAWTLENLENHKIF